MAIPWIIPFKLMAFLDIFFFLFSVFPLILAREACPVSRCGSNGSTIGFPFHLVGQQHQNCGYPGFNLSCGSPGITVLRLPYWGEFFVRGINYITQEIQLYDPDNCLPKRLLAFDITGSPFMAEYYLNYTFLICPSELTRSRFTAIDCLSNSTSSVLATSSMSLVSKMSSCQILTTLAVPVSWPVQNEEEFSSDLNSDLQLTWDVPSCGDCEAQGRSCGFQNSSSLEVGCFSTPGTGTWSFLIFADSFSLHLLLHQRFSQSQRLHTAI